MARSVALSLLIFILTGFLYFESLRHQFHYDDVHSIVENPHIRSLDNVRLFFRDAATFSVIPENAMYRPLLLVSYALNHAADGLNPRGYHLLNVVLHAANSALVFCLLLGVCRRPALSLAAAALFAATPMNAEAVNYISSRSELLMGFFFLLASWAYAGFARSANRIWYALAMACAFLAVLSKSVAVILACVIPAIDLLISGRSGWVSRLKYQLPFLLIGIVYVVATSDLVYKALNSPVRPFDIQAYTQLKAAAFYLALWCMPVALTVDHQFFPALAWSDPPVLAGFAFIGSLVALWIYGGSRLLKFAGWWWMMLLLPSALVPLIVLVNEHRVYLAGMGLCLVGAWAISRLPRRGGVALISSVAYVLILASVSNQRTAVWADELTLWRDAAEKGPLMVKPHLRLGDALVDAARKEGSPSHRSELLSRAEQSYLRALELRSQHPGALNNLGSLYLN